MPALSELHLPCQHTLRATWRASGWRNVPKARLLNASDVILPVEVGLHVVGAAMVPVQRLHWLMDTAAIERGRQHPDRPLPLLSGHQNTQVGTHAPFIRMAHPSLGWDLEADSA